MSDDDTLSEGPTHVVVEPAELRPVFADWIVTGGRFEGVVNLALGTVDYNLRARGDDPFRVILCANLRMSVAFATRLHTALGHILSDEGEPAADPVAPPPGGLVN